MLFQKGLVYLELKFAATERSVFLYLIKYFKISRKHTLHLGKDRR